MGALSLSSVVPVTPVGAAETDSDTFVFVPPPNLSEIGFTVVRNGQGTQLSQPGASVAFEGDFSGAPGTDIFLYNPGTGPDAVLFVEPSGIGVTTSRLPKSVNGSYTPLVGDFDGNTIDDVFWYGPGRDLDFLWLFDASGSHSSRRMTVTGSYQPTVFEANGDGIDDIIWYAPGTAGDSIWRFGIGASHVSRAVSIFGTYQLVPGQFGIRPEGSPQKRLIFFNRSGPDFVWTFDTGMDHTSQLLPAIDGPFVEPVVGTFTDTVTDAILWYGPGQDPDALWDFTDAGAVNQLEPVPVYGRWPTVAVGDADGNGYQDIVWSDVWQKGLWLFGDGGVTKLHFPVGTFAFEVRVSHTDPSTLD